MDPEQQKIIEKIAGAVEQKLAGEGSGHDWWHIVRVWNMAKHIAKCEGAADATESATARSADGSLIFIPPTVAT